MDDDARPFRWTKTAERMIDRIHLLAGARWDANAVRDDVRAYVVEHLGDPGAVLGSAIQEGQCQCRRATPIHRHRRATPPGQEVRLEYQ